MFRWFLLFAAVLAAGCSGGPVARTDRVATAAPVPDGPVMADDAALARAAGQLLIVGFRGTQLPPDHHLWRDIRDYGLGGVVLYEYDVPGETRPRNITAPAQVRTLTAALQAAAAAAGQPPLIVAVDQEGGRVNRLREAYGFPPSVSARHLGELDDADTTAYWSGLTARALQDAGITLNFAPVVDLNVNSTSPAIGALARSFSADPAVVVRHAAVVIREHHRAGVRVALKHFPGHGSATADSHLGLTDISATWTERELAPFRALPAADAIMSAHVYNAALDPDWPATLSPRIIGGLLRRDGQWDKAVISDDMMMGAITRQYGRAEAVARALNAGCDLLIFSNNAPAGYEPGIVPEVVGIIRAHLASGLVSRERLRDALRHAAALRLPVAAP
ncbi:MAG TPA: glycoside hydrolase family 3 N-terminal domain-containing protein [bacterium]|nr:glycoside hydrolase family 3 N-terminal domain-containing protein [bacterium]